LLARKGRLHRWQILISTRLEYQKMRVSLTDFGFQKRILSFQRVQEKFSLYRAYFLYAKGRNATVMERVLSLAIRDANL